MILEDSELGSFPSCRICFNYRYIYLKLLSVNSRFICQILADSELGSFPSCRICFNYGYIYLKLLSMNSRFICQILAVWLIGSSWITMIVGCVIVGSVDGNRIWGKELRGQQLAHVVVRVFCPQHNVQSNIMKQ